MSTEGFANLVKFSKILGKSTIDDVVKSSPRRHMSKLRQSTSLSKQYTIHSLAHSCKAPYSTFECVKKVDTYIRKKSRKKNKMISFHF
jgi:hypothetical protein